MNFCKGDVIMYQNQYSKFKIGIIVSEHVSGYCLNEYKTITGSYNRIIIEKHNSARIKKINKLEVFEYLIDELNKSLFSTYQQIEKSYKSINEFNQKVGIINYDCKKYSDNIIRDYNRVINDLFDHIEYIRKTQYEKITDFLCSTFL